MGNPIARNGAVVECIFGAAPTPLVVLPTARVTAEGAPAANIASFLPTNIKTFGMCKSLGNPQVATATTLALGVLTQMPCVPMLTPWKPGSPKTLIGGVHALVAGSTCQCLYGGVITIKMAGTLKTSG